MSRENKDFENPLSPGSYPELTAYLAEYGDVDPATVVSLHRIPPLIGGPKSNRFIIRDEEAFPDVSPDTIVRIDLKSVAVAADGLAAFTNFFDRAEAQADSQYDIAISEARRLVAEAASGGVDVKLLFVPGEVNSSAKDYFRRLTRLAQDMGISVATRVVDYEEGEAYESFQRFDPVEAPSVDHYWRARANETGVLSGNKVRLGNYAVYTMESAYNFDDPPAEEVLANIAAPAIRPPLVFTSFEQLQEDYPNSEISDPEVWEANKDSFELVSDDAEYQRLEHECRAERDNLRNNMRYAARLGTGELRQLLLGDDAPFAEKLPVIRDLAANPGDWRTEARIILAKLGDKENAQIILREIEDKDDNWSYESRTMVPLGIHLRHDEKLFHTVAEDVRSIIAKDPKSSHRLLHLLGALYHSHDERLGNLLATYLTVPKHDTKAYASTVLHAAARWLPDYVMGLAYQPSSYYRNRSLQAIENRLAEFIDAHSRGELEDVSKHMTFAPEFMVPLLFWFRNPAHRPILERSVMRQFKKGGSIVADRGFEDLYLLYREQYGDMPEVSRHIRS